MHHRRAVNWNADVKALSVRQRRETSASDHCLADRYVHNSIVVWCTARYHVEYQMIFSVVPA